MFSRIKPFTLNINYVHLDVLNWLRPGLPVQNQSTESTDMTMAPKCSRVNVARLSFASTVDFLIILDAVLMVNEIIFTVSMQAFNEYFESCNRS